MFSVIATDLAHVTSIIHNTMNIVNMIKLFFRKIRQELDDEEEVPEVVEEEEVVENNDNIEKKIENIEKKIEDIYNLLKDKQD